MFVRDVAVLDVSFDRAVACLDAEADVVFGAAAEAARTEDERLRARVGPAGWPAALSKSVELRVTPPRSLGDGVILSLSWVASGAPSLFPALEAELEVLPHEPDSTRLVLRGSYDPPGGAVGRGLDRLFLHRVAEATVRAFLDTACAAISERAATYAASTTSQGRQDD